jgi:hypothetical protein
MSSPVEPQLVYSFANAPMRGWPFPHLYIENVFPADYFRRMRRMLPPLDEYASMAALGRSPPGIYDERFMFEMLPENLARLDEERRAFWVDLVQWMSGPHFASVAVSRFAPALQRQWPKPLNQLNHQIEIFLTKDAEGYAIPPHTDRKSRLLSVLFYIPPDDRLAAYGTSIYMPTFPGPYSDDNYAFDDFLAVATAPYVPNAALAFPRLDNSFHGVPPIAQPALERDMLMYILRAV